MIHNMIQYTTATIHKNKKLIHDTIHILTTISITKCARLISKICLPKMWLTSYLNSGG